MGCTGREKHIRTNRRPKSTKPDTDNSIPKSINPQINESNTNPNFDDNGWGYCTEEQLEEILLKNLEFLYNESISKLVSLGFSEEIALCAILRNGHCYGGMDVLSNILHNCLAYLNSHGGDGNGELEESEPVFVDLKQLEEYSLAGMVVLLQQVRPNLSKGDAMWCLLMSDLHVGRASAMEIPVIRPPSNGYRLENCKVENVGNNSGAIVPAPGLCKFHGGWGFGNNGGGSELYANGGFSEYTMQKEFYFPKRFNLTPSMQSLLRENVAAFAAGFRANNSNHAQPRLHACPSSVSGGKMPTVAEAPIKNPEDPKIEDVVSAVLNKFHDLNIDENAELLSDEKKDEMILSLINHIKDMERQVKDRKEWAHQKAMQAARKLSSDLTELKTLRMEREETQRLKKGKQTLEDSTVKKLSEMENALRKASGQVDRANAAVRRLETENAEIKAEMEASKLSASESVTTCLEVAKREKKYLKRLLAWEKQKSKVQEEIAAEKKNIMEMQLQLMQIDQDQKEAEVKWREELNAKDLALAQVEDEQRLKEAAEAANKRKLEVLRLNIEIDFKRHKDDLQRLEQELSRLKTANEEISRLKPSTEVLDPVTDFQEETIAGMLHDLNIMDNCSENGDRECMICMRDEVSIVFLPCAHQVLCANCNEGYGKKGKPGLCPCCRTPIEQRVRVFGASS